ncbi:hypothetical protein [Fulvivirga sediminis]|uniref:Uncharacterized protein n=1 Tax=Fulvivirga sediminis TaxID=2803949 RepID=A0A937F6L6_9BACT|nr:hypothetical protein [Fulvivirga sediminis]MBL3655589.1 hypothetical protein [Fulvivirga sediminis]
MRSVFFTITCLFIFSYHAQAQNIDKQKTKILYTQLPSKPLPEGITKYHVRTSLGAIPSSESRTEITNRLKSASEISHLEKTNDEGLKVLAKLESYYKGDTKYESVTRKEKRDDKEISVTYYYLTFEYKFPVYVEITLPDEVDPYFAQFVANSNSPSQYRSREFQSSSALNSWWSESYNSVQAELRKKMLGQYISELQSTISTNFSYHKEPLYTEFLTVKKFKKFEYADLDEAWEKAKVALDKISENDIVFSADFNSAMLEAISMWQTALNESDLEDKKSRINKKVTEAIYNNMFLAYTMMSEFEKAEEIKQIAEERINKRAIDNYAENFLIGRKQRFEANEGRIPASI